MKRFIVSILSVAVFFIGLGSLVDKVGAKFKSDERALAIIRQARIAVGGEDAIKNVRSLTISGRATQTFNINGVDRTEQGDVEVALQLPNKFTKMMKFGTGGGLEGADAKIINQDFVVIRKGEGDAAALNQVNSNSGNQKVVIMRRGGGETGDLLKEGAVSADGVNKIVVDKNMRFAGEGFHQNEIFRTTFALLLSAPEGVDVTYLDGGEGSIDGNACDIVQAQTSGDASAIKLYIDKSTHLPLMMSYQAMKPVVIKFDKNEAQPNGGAEKRIKVLTANAEHPETAEYQVKFADYRTVGGVQLPFKWTQTANGQIDQNLDVTNYEINPANIADKFSKTPQRIMIKTDKTQ